MERKVYSISASWDHLLLSRLISAENLGSAIDEYLNGEYIDLNNISKITFKEVVKHGKTD